MRSGVVEDAVIVVFGVSWARGWLRKGCGDARSVHEWRMIAPDHDPEPSKSQGGEHTEPIKLMKPL